MTACFYTRISTDTPRSVSYTHLLLRYYTGLAVKEIACVLSLSENAVSARLKRARDRLRQALA